MSPRAGLPNRWILTNSLHKPCLSTMLSGPWCVCMCVCVCVRGGESGSPGSPRPLTHAQGSCKTQFRVFYLLPPHFSWDLNFLCSSENPSCSWGGRLRVGSPLDGGTCWGGHRRSSKGGQGLVTVTLVCSGLALGAGGEAPISL